MVNDCREDLINDILNECLSNGIDVDYIKNSIWVVCDKYEITNRTTDVAILDEEYNGNLIKKFLICKSVKGCTERTIEFYKSVLVKVIPAIGKNIRDIDKADIRLYIAKRQKLDKVSKTTINNELRVIKSFYTWLHNEGHVKKNIAMHIEQLKMDKKRKEAFTELEIEKMRSSINNTRDRAMFEVLLSTGCRVTELVEMKIENIHDDEVMIKGKGNKYRKVFLNAKSQVALLKYLSEREDDNSYVFCGYVSVCGKQRVFKEWWKHQELINDTHIDKGTVEEIFRKLGRNLGIKRSNPHKFRRTCATLALRKGMPLEQVSKMLGHEQLDTTKIYLDINDDELKAFHMKYVN